MASRPRPCRCRRRPATSLLSAGFAGDTGFGPSGASLTFPVNQAGTSLTIAGPSSAQVGTPSGVTALLKSGMTPLSFKTVWFVLTGPSTATVAVDTNLAGVASLGNAPSIGGQYTITACFSKPSPAGTCPTAASLDSTYAPAKSSPALPFAATWPFTGFLSPVDNLPTVNVATAGSAIPVKFSLGGDRGLSILAAGSPGIVKFTCSATAPTDVIEETSTALTNSLEFSGGQYKYNWKTLKTLRRILLPVPAQARRRNHVHRQLQVQVALAIIANATPERSPLRRLHVVATRDCVRQPGNPAGRHGVSATVIKWRAVHWKMPS